MAYRRKFLKTGVAISAGLSASLAGCLGFGTTDASEWFVDPSRLAGQVDEYPIVSFSPTTLNEHSSEFYRDDFESFEDSFLGSYDFAGLRADEIDRITTGYSGFTNGGFDVIVGDFEAEDLEDNLRRADFQPQGDYEGYELFETDSNEFHIPSVAGVASGTLLTAQNRGGDNSRLRVIEDIIDTKEGEVRRYQELDSDFEMLIENSSIGDYFVGLTFDPPDTIDPERGSFRDMVGISQSIDVSEEESSVEIVLVFQRDYEPREFDIEDWVQGDDEFRTWRDIEITTDEGNVTIQGDILTRDVIETMIGT